jgi:hypothetical protein
MQALDQHLVTFLQDRNSNDPTWMHLQVIYSSYLVPGEGEHKFFEYIRGVHESREKSHVVYSPDADLIFLGLQTRYPFFYIMREWDAWMGPIEKVGNGSIDKLKASDLDFEILHLPLLREYFALDFKDCGDIDLLIDDFTAFSYLVGNDFVPHFPDVILQEGDFEVIIDVYQETILSTKVRLVSDGKFNKQALGPFLKAVVKKMGESDPKGKRKRHGPGSLSAPDERTAAEWLRRKYPTESDYAALERRLSLAILDSFDWTMTYYTKGCCSWSWTWKDHYAPPLILVAKYCEQHTSHFELDRPPLPYEQLLYILPPSRAGFLPSALQRLMFPPSDIAHCFPDKFTVDLNGRRYEHDGVLLIPFIDLALIRERVGELIAHLSDGEAERNEVKVPLVFVDGADPEIFDIANHPPGSAAKPMVASSFGRLPFWIEKRRGVRVFAVASQWISVFIHPEPTRFQPEPFTSASQVAHLIEKVVLVNWPHFRPALVVAAIDSKGRVPPGDGRGKPPSAIVQDVQYKSGQNGIWLQGSDESKERPIDLLLMVRPVVYTNLAQTRFDFSPMTFCLPYILTASIDYAPHIRDMFSAREPESELMAGDKVLVCKGRHAGRWGRVQRLNNDGTVDVTLWQFAALPSFTEMIAEDAQQWINIEVLFDHLKLPRENGLQFLKSLPVVFKGEGPKKEFVDLACTAMFDRRVLDGCCRRNQAQYEVTRQFEDFARSFLEKPFVGELGKFLREYQQQSERFQISLESVWGDQARAQQCKQDLVRFIRFEMPAKRFFLVDDTIQSIAQHTLEQMEAAIRPYRDRSGKRTDEVVTLAPDTLTWAGKGKRRPQGRGVIGQRVVNVADLGAIQFGARGTVIGIDALQGLYYVLLDCDEEYATTLRKRLASKRGHVSKIDDLFFVPSE